MIAGFVTDCHDDPQMLQGKIYIPLYRPSALSFESIFDLMTQQMFHFVGDIVSKK